MTEHARQVLLDSLRKDLAQLTPAQQQEHQVSVGTTDRRLGADTRLAAATDQVKKLHMILNTNPQVRALEEEVKQVEALLVSLEDRQNWMEVVNKKVRMATSCVDSAVSVAAQGIRTSYRNERSTPVHSIKVEGDIRASMFNILSTPRVSRCFICS